jgi:[ribosomal protein S18]-alanine N-acetyltransferase
MTDPTLRDYQPDSDSEDWRAMHALDVLCFAPPFRFTRSAMRRFAETPGAITLLAESDAQLAGFCIAHIETLRREAPQLQSQPIETRQTEARTGYVVTLDVAPAWRRKGLARRLMHQLETRAHAAGAESIALHVFSGNTAALQLYEALGYQRAEIARDFYGPGLDALVYTKPLERNRLAATVPQ